jgi:hypothetical protein
MNEDSITYESQAENGDVISITSVSYLVFSPNKQTNPPDFSAGSDEGGVSKLCFAAEPHKAMRGFNEGQEVESTARVLKNKLTNITSDIRHNFSDK